VLWLIESNHLIIHWSYRYMDVAYQGNAGVIAEVQVLLNPPYNFEINE